VAVLLALAVAGDLAGSWRPCPQVQPDLPRLLVQPFVDLGRTDSSAAIARGLTQEIVGQSAKVKVTVSQDILKAIARGEGPRPALVALGYAGWASGQLESEMAANAWLSVPTSPAILFETPIEQRWQAAAGLLGVDIRQVTSYAGHA